MEKLRQELRRINQKSYKAYKDIANMYTFPDFRLVIDYVQGDPFAAPSKIRLIFSKEKLGIDRSWFETKRRKIYVEDVINRSVNFAIQQSKIVVRGSGKSGRIEIDAPDQVILERSAVQLTPNQGTICLSIGLPANGRRINGKEAEKLFFDALTDIAKQSILSLDKEVVVNAVQLADQHDALRQKMSEEGWIAFVANGSILPRKSGISTKPMNDAVAFQSPEENEVSVELPHRTEPLKGMAIKKGITLIVGGGFHGKSTLLQALEEGVYEHIAGDGREFVLTDPTATKIRAEDGRSIIGVDISPFINDLPNGASTNKFSTENASGSTSQAANVVEALEAGANTLLIDEDTTATNFMIRDQRMQQLVAKEKEPITPFVQRVKSLFDDKGISTILVMGGSGDYFQVADEVIMMDQYYPKNVTKKAKEIAGEPLIRTKSLEFQQNRVPSLGGLQSLLGHKPKVQAKGKNTILFGKNPIDLSLVEQIVDVSQTRMIANVLKYMALKKSNEQKSIPEWLDWIEHQIDEFGLSFTQKNTQEHPGELARPRRLELASALNRIRKLTM
uniref:ABC-ATPase domain-containing protein n=1 Tax=uncultured Allobacillus sp. TaxID=1638025 RepID=UPI0025957DE3|nr:ABC-ATPase domain-containing protein [uncultured Allobacillus sp.]